MALAKSFDGVYFAGNAGARDAQAAAIAVPRSGATDSIPSLKEVLEFRGERP